MLKFFFGLVDGHSVIIHSIIFESYITVMSLL
jgi:hypothetical protein